MKYVRAAVISIAIGIAFTSLSVAAAIILFPNWNSVLGEIILWNFSVASALAANGWLPMCFDCELVSLIFVIADGFAIGFIVYSLVAFVGQVVFLRMRAV